MWNEDAVFNITSYLEQGWWNLLEPVQGYLITVSKLITNISLSISFIYYPEISMGVEEPSKLRRLYPNVEYNSIWRLLKNDSFFEHEKVFKLIKDKRSIFTDELVLGESYAIYSAEKNLTGYVERYERIPDKPDILRITGWAYYNIKGKYSPQKLYIVDSANVVSGYIAGGIERSDVEKEFGHHAKYSGFVGYIHIDGNIDSRKHYFIDKISGLKRAFILPESIMRDIVREMKEK